MGIVIIVLFLVALEVVLVWGLLSDVWRRRFQEGDIPLLVFLCVLSAVNGFGLAHVLLS